MSDVIRPDENHEQDQSNQQIGHSGDLGLEKPFHQLGTPLESAPVHPVPDTVDEFVKLEPTKKRNWLKPVGGTAAALALAIGAYVAGSSGDDKEPSAISTPTTDLLVPTTEPEITTEPETTGEVVGELAPVLMTARTYNGLASQLKQNLLCMFNSGYTSVQEKCLVYLVGDEPGDLTSLMRQRLADVNDYRISNPDYEVEINFSDPTPGDTQDNLKISGDTAVLVTKLTDDVSSELKRYSFRLMPVSIQEVAVEDTASEAWVLFKEEPLSEGEVSFG
jgi:hypothetical protein